MFYIKKELTDNKSIKLNTFVGLAYKCLRLIIFK